MWPAPDCSLASVDAATERPLSPFGGVEFDARLPAVPTVEKYGFAVWLNCQIRRSGMVVVRNLKLTRAEFAGLGIDLGRAVASPFLAVSEYPGVTVLERGGETNRSARIGSQPAVFGGGWHVDLSFLAEPPSLSCLYCEVAPQAGGRTLFADAGAAVHCLAPTTRDLLAARTAIHSSAGSYSAAGHYARRGVVGAAVVPSAEVRTAEHPVLSPSMSSRSVLTVNPAYTNHLVGSTPDTSRPVLRYLYSLMFQDDLVILLTWERHMLVVWDNRRYPHRAQSDPLQGRRRLLRLNIQTDI